PRGGVDRNRLSGALERPAPGRPPRGGVDRNIAMTRSTCGASSRPPRGGVDRNTISCNVPVLVGGRPRAGRASKPVRPPAPLETGPVAPRAGAWIETSRLWSIHACGRVAHAVSDRNCFEWAAFKAHG